MISKDSIQNLHNQSRVLLKGADFVYLLPHPALRKWISNYTVTFPHANMMSDNYSVIPHGSATLVFSFDGNRIRSNFFGPITKSAQIGRQANFFKFIFIVEFQPAGYYAFCNIPQTELTDCLLPFDVVFPVLNKLTTEKIETSHDLTCMTAEIDKLFLTHLKIAYYKPEFSLANQLIRFSGGLISVKELSQNIFYSERHLNRIFEKYLGIGIKSFSRLVRVNKAIRLLRRRDYNLTKVYLETGFYDMSHFINDFKIICGITPNEYRKNMSDFYSEIAKF